MVLIKRRMLLREIKASKIIKVVSKMCIEANCELGEDVLTALRESLKKEESPLGKRVIKKLLKNAEIAKEERIPICQDTGIAVFFLELGQEVHIVGDLKEAINQGVRIGYRRGYLRKSVVGHPFLRKNTSDNTPAVIHTEIVPGDKLKIIFFPKGAGSENMSEAKALKPAEGKEGVKRFVLKVVREAGSNPCPPIIVGVGVGGTLESSALLSKKALLRPVGEDSPLRDIAKLERELLKEVNNLGIGPQGLGGKVTALAVNIEVFPCHIASLPVAVNIGCWVNRHLITVI